MKSHHHREEDCARKKYFAVVAFNLMPGNSIVDSEYILITFYRRRDARRYARSLARSLRKKRIPVGIVLTYSYGEELPWERK